MTSSPPFFSVIIPVFNGEFFLRELFSCLKTQTHQDFECLFVDDGSTDQSVAMIQAFIETTGQSRIFLQPHTGLPARARNLAIKHAQGKFIFFLDCDDLLHPQCLEFYFHAFQHNPDLKILTCTASADFKNDASTLRFDSLETYQIHVGSVLKPLLKENFLKTPGTAILKDVLTPRGGFDESPQLKIGEDYLLWLTLAKKIPFGQIHTPLVYIRCHSANTTRYKAPLVQGLMAISKHFQGSIDDQSIFLALKAQALKSQGLQQLRSGNFLQGLQSLIQSLKHRIRIDTLGILVLSPLLSRGRETKNPHHLVGTENSEN